MTVGTGTFRRSDRNSAPLRWTISAFSFSTRTTARRDETTQSGSKLALRSSARATVDHLPLRRECTCALRPSLSVRARGPAPFEIADHVVDPGCRVGSVRGLEAEPQVRTIGNGNEWRPRPPPRRDRPARLATRGRPKVWPPEHRRCTMEPKRRAVRHAWVAAGWAHA